ncbi:MULTISPECIES: hypothetical protein [unclassified Frondihabitans]|uniref:hypothetical protein n=1 Tax=unclassified Frondihabitans TaxID=2626248 RepID=UPI000F4EACC9|nr:MULTISPECIES: hypothetical protein [unclassified Frondihabitans]RPE75193.1 hypothetical protein EDF37_2797 [Frondihabitans sp. PhB153]RPF04435.1 hypothetical protein EDF39_2865 [Frondihabitans sp. PhB161]
MTDWLSASGAAEYAGCHVETVRDALRAQELRGVQRVKAGTWRTTAEWVDTWLGLDSPGA